MNDLSVHTGPGRLERFVNTQAIAEIVGRTLRTKYSSSKNQQRSSVAEWALTLSDDLTS